MRREAANRVTINCWYQSCAGGSITHLDEDQHALGEVSHLLVLVGRDEVHITQQLVLVRRRLRQNTHGLESEATLGVAAEGANSSTPLPPPSQGRRVTGAWWVFRRAADGVGYIAQSCVTHQSEPCEVRLLEACVLRCPQ